MSSLETGVKAVLNEREMKENSQALTELDCLPSENKYVGEFFSS